MNEDGSYAIADDGDREENVQPALVRVPELFRPTLLRPGDGGATASSPSNRSVPAGWSQQPKRTRPTASST